MLLALAVVVAIPVLVHRANERNSPEATARAYLQLLADGHADQATRQVPPAVPDWVTPAPELLTDATLGSAGYPQTAVLLCPGVYTLRGLESPWVTAQSQLVASAAMPATQTSLSSPNDQVWSAATDAL